MNRSMIALGMARAVRGARGILRNHRSDVNEVVVLVGKHLVCWNMCLLDLKLKKVELQKAGAGHA